MNRSFILFALFMGALATGWGQAQFRFLPGELAQPGFTYATAAADFTGDGNADLAVSTIDGVHCYPGRGDGTFAAPVRNVTTGAWVLTVADFNRDGKADLLTDRSIALGLGDCRFTPVESTPRYQAYGAIGDYNEDGILDAMADSTPAYAIRAAFGQGDGTFRVGGPEIPTYGWRLFEVHAAGDLNLDGHADLFAAPASAGFTSCELLGDGRGAFRMGRCLASYGLLAVGDLDGDGRPDLIQGAEGAIQVVLNRKDGLIAGFRTGFPDCREEDFYSCDGGAILADFDGDKRLDLLYRYIAAPAEYTYFFKGLGDGGFAPGKELRQLAGRPVLADWNRDGLPDLAVSGVSPIRIAIAQPPPLPIAVSSAGNVALVAHGSLASLYASGLATKTEVSPSLSSPPTSLGGVRLRVVDAAGNRLFAPLLYVSPEQINFQVPEGAGTGWAILDLVEGEFSRQVGWMEIRSVAPSLFPVLTGVRILIDGTFAPMNLDAAPWDLPAQVTFYGTGFRGLGAEDVRVLVHTSALTPVSVGPHPGIAGLDLIVVTVLPSVRANNNDGDSYWGYVQVQAGGLKSNGFYTGIY